jgi:ABC-2 type transport system permease protein
MSYAREHLGLRLKREAGSLRAFLLRDLDLTKRYLGWDIVWLVYNLINAVTIALIAVSSEASPAYVPAGQSYVFYLSIGAIMWSYLSVLFYIVSEAVAWERWEGTLEYTFMAPVHRLTHLTGVCAFAAIYGLVRIVLMLLLIVWVFRLDLSQANIPAALSVLLVASFAMLGLGLMGAVLPLMSPEKGAQGAHILLAVLLLVSGVYYPITVLPEWMQPLAWFCPMYWALNALRASLLEGAGFGLIWRDLVMLALSGAVYIPLGYWFFSIAERYAKKHGLLKRSG